MGMVNVQADGLNVRVTPNGPPVMSLVNGVPLVPLGREGDWLLVAAGCDLTPIMGMVVDRRCSTSVLGVLLIRKLLLAGIAASWSHVPHLED